MAGRTPNALDACPYLAVAHDGRVHTNEVARELLALVLEKTTTTSSHKPLPPGAKSELQGSLPYPHTDQE
jgi:hypothetical protein